MHSLVRAIRTVIAKLNQPSASCPDHAQPPCPRSTLYSELCSKKLLYKAIQRRRPVRQGRSAVELIQRSTPYSNTALYIIQRSTIPLRDPRTGTYIRSTHLPHARYVTCTITRRPCPRAAPLPQTADRLKPPTRSFSRHESMSTPGEKGRGGVDG